MVARRGYWASLDLDFRNATPRACHSDTDPALSLELQYKYSIVDNNILINMFVDFWKGLGTQDFQIFLSKVSYKKRWHSSLKLLFGRPPHINTLAVYVHNSLAIL